MNIERKYIDFKDLKMSDTGNGSVEGYRSVFGEIDEGGDIVLKGAFADCLNDYLASGFSAHSHDWKFTEAVGYPVEAREDDYGWWVKSEFHSTQTAQDARTIAAERHKAGKQVGFSFGYLPVEYEYIDAKDYKEKLPLYLKADRLEPNLTKAQKFNRIRLLKKVEAPEDSLVLAGMNKLAAATAVKTSTQLFEPQMDALIEAHGQEKIIDYLKGITGTESFESFEAAGTELKKFAQQMRANHEIRAKEGRVLSSSNRAKVQTCRDSMTALIVDLDDLLAMSEPKPKEKSINVAALKAQADRVWSNLLRDFS